MASQDMTDGNIKAEGARAALADSVTGQQDIVHASQADETRLGSGPQSWQ